MSRFYEQNISKNSEVVELIFRVIYLLFTFIGINSFMYQSRYVGILTMVVMLLAMAIVFIRIKFQFKKMLHKNVIFLIFFLISYIISAIINIEYGITGNIKGFVWLFFQLFLLYVSNVDRTVVEIRKELKLIFLTLTVCVGTMNLMSIIMLFTGYNGKHEFFNGRSAFFGMVNGRLWGMYIDPNHGAIVTAVAILVCLYFFKECKNIYGKLVSAILVFINILYLTFSDSRTGLVCICTGIFSYVFLSLFYRKRGSVCKNIKRRILFCTIIALMATSFTYILPKSIKVIYNFSIEKQEADDEGIKTELGREEDLQGDISNRRFDIWMSGVEVFNTSKFTGVSFRNILPYVRVNLPKTYIVNNDATIFNSFHNIFVDVLASQGIFGILSFLLFIFFTLKFILAKILHFYSDIIKEGILLFSCIGCLAVGALFVSAIFYANSPHTVLFWIFLGYLVLICQKFSGKEIKNKI